MAYLKQQNNSTIVAFYQDEPSIVKKESKWLIAVTSKLFFSMQDNEYHNTYKNNTSAYKVYHNLTGYIDDFLVKSANVFRKSFNMLNNTVSAACPFCVLFITTLSP